MERPGDGFMEECSVIVIQVDIKVFGKTMFNKIDKTPKRVCYIKHKGGLKWFKVTKNITK